MPADASRNAWYNVRDLGAVGDGKTLDTAALQRAIDICARNGGGTVFCPPGDYLTGTLVLRSHVTLELSTGCTLWGSTNLDHYPSYVPEFRSFTDEYTERSLIYAEKTEGTALVGRGTINGNGAAFKDDDGNSWPFKQRPYMMRFVECTHLLVSGITLKDSPMWTQHYLACTDVLIENVTVRTRTANHNGDGIDIDSCTRVVVTGCNIDSQDDALCLKSTSPRKCRDIVITNCILTSRCNAFKLGTESVGGFENITLTNCTVYNTGLSGIMLGTVDGGDLQRVVISNVVMDQVGSVICLRRGQRMRPYMEGKVLEHPGVLKGVTISNIKATGVSMIGCPIAGLPEYPIEDVSLRNIEIEFGGGGSLEHAWREIPEIPQDYPEFVMFGILPAYGFYVRHVHNISMDQVKVGFRGTDLRPALICDNVEGLVLDRFSADRAEGGLPPIRLVNTRGAFLRGRPPTENLLPFVSIAGPNTNNLILDPLLMIAGQKRSTSARTSLRTPYTIVPADDTTGYLDSSICSVTADRALKRGYVVFVGALGAIQAWYDPTLYCITS